MDGKDEILAAISELRNETRVGFTNTRQQIVNLHNEVASLRNDNGINSRLLGEHITRFITDHINSRLDAMIDHIVALSQHEHHHKHGIDGREEAA